MQLLATVPCQTAGPGTPSLDFSAAYVLLCFGGEPALQWWRHFTETGAGMTGQTWGVWSRRKRTLLPLLIVLFLVSYGLLTTLVIEQNRTISSQRTLIHLLFKDSLHLSVLRKAERQKAHAAQGIPASDLQADAKTPSAKIPVIQVPHDE